MTIYAGLDISDKSTHICVVDDAGKIAWRGVRATDPDAIAKTLERRAAGAGGLYWRRGRCRRFSITGWSSGASSGSSGDIIPNS